MQVNSMRIPSRLMVVAGLLASSSAFAQTPPSAAPQGEMAQPEAEALGGITDIIVTARRRSESLQRVPIAATAFDAVALEKANITTALGVAQITPGVTMTEFNVGEPQTYIRGVGSQSDSVASEPSVLISIDEVPIGRGGVSPVAFLDTARVEVLRGPQGTLYGRNASAGSVNYYSNRPTDQFEGWIEGSVGSFSTFGGRGMVNAPVAEGIAIRAAGQYSKSDGYARNIRLGTDLQGGTRYSGRAQLQAQTGDWTFLLTGDYAKADLDGDSRFITCAINAVPALCAAARTLQANQTNPWHSQGSPGTFQYRRNYGVSGRIEYDAGFAILTSLTSYRNNSSASVADYFGLRPGFAFTTDNSISDRSHQFTQELRATSGSSSPVQWVGGLFYYDDKIRRNERFIIKVATPPFPAGLAGDTTALQNGSTTSYAAFGQLTLPFASIWELTVGGRITHDKKEVFQAGFRNIPAPGLGFPLFPGQPYDVLASKSFTKPTWRASLAVEPSPGKRFYVSYDRGYKSGTFISQAQTAALAQFAVKPEQLDSFNLGMKTQWLDNHFRFNADIYYLDYKDLQVYEFGANFTSVLANAQARVKGIEIQALAAPTRNVSVGTNFSYIDGKFRSNPSFGSVTLAYKGNQLPRAPKYKISTFAELSGEVFDGEIVGRVSYDLQDSFFYNPSNDLAGRQRSYGLLGARVSWEGPAKIKLALSADNITSTRYSVHNISFQGLALQIYAPPRNVTFTVTKSF